MARRKKEHKIEEFLNGVVFTYTVEILFVKAK